MYRLQEESTTEIEENQPEDSDLPIPVPSTEQMANKENWVHFTRNILKCNRITHLEPEVDDDADVEEIKKKIEKADPYEPRLKSITADSSVKGLNSSWVLRKFGDFTSFASANPLHGRQNFGIVMVKSLNWPGSHSFFSQGRWS